MIPIERIMRSAPVIPVLVIEDVAHARPIAEALVAGGLPVLEVTLRTPAALEAIAEMKRVPGAVVGAGTVVDVAGLDAALQAGAEFIVSPGLTERLGAAAKARAVPFLPGVANAGDIMRGLELGFTHFKFFPAESSGGVSALKALLGPFAQCQFCPTGGITPERAAAWFALPQVLCVGGSWLVPKGAPDMAAITAAARAAVALRP
ncbi:MAG: 2-dehydro-3-deoxyphosphogluconate aldolase [Gemmatimonas sp.]|nr:2-dehydro-3-deoxyphosphogluconate aldolase [Gemmatimonas sp.]